MTSGADVMTSGRLLTVEAAAERMSTSVRFVRRLIAERRIEFVRIGRHVRISESALADFIKAGRVEPLTAADGHPAQRERSRVMAKGNKPDIGVSATSAGFLPAAIRSATPGRMARRRTLRRRLSARATLKGRSC